MKRLSTPRWVVIIIALTYAHHTYPDRIVIPNFSIRSQSVDAARELVGWQPHINICSLDYLYGSFAITPEYTRTFNPDSILRCLFGDDLVRTNVWVTNDCGNTRCTTDCPNQIVISGSTSENRGPRDWLADNFGLPRDFKSVLSFCPTIQNGMIDINFYLGLDEVTSGLYVRVHAPMVWSKWQLNPNETIINAGTDTSIGTDLASTSGRYPAGYFSDVEIAHNRQTATALDFLTGQTAPQLGSANIGTLSFQSLRYAKLIPYNCSCPKDELFRLSDVELAVGYNFLCNDDEHLGLTVRASAPTGNVPRSEYLFEPIIGSGGYWKLGAGITGHYTFWRNDAATDEIGIWVDVNMQHWFNSRQRRTFDLVGKPLSRYMLAERLGALPPADPPPVNPPFHMTGQQFEFQSQFAPVANLTTGTVKISVAIEADFVVKIGYRHRGWEIDAGYNLWARSCDCIEPIPKCPNNLLNDISWALKGDAWVIGFKETEPAQPVPLAATESFATIHSGTNNGSTTNAGINTPINVTSDAQPVNNIAGVTTNSSAEPIFITAATIAYNDNSMEGMSHKVFAHLSYSFDIDRDWQPFFGGGGYAEFGSCGGRIEAATISCSPQCLGCQSCAISQWGVWLKGGISFE